MALARGRILCDRQQIYRHSPDRDVSPPLPQHDRPTYLQSFTRSWTQRDALEGKRAALLKASPNRASVAAFDPASGLVAIFAATHESCTLVSEFNPSETARPPREPFDRVVLLSWSGDGSQLAVGTASGCLYVLNSRGALWRSWGEGEPWARAGLTGIAFLADGRMLVLCGRGNLYAIQPKKNDHSIELTLSAHHRLARCMAYARDSSTLVVVGDGPSSPDKASKDNSQGKEEEASITLSLWEHDCGRGSWECKLSFGTQPGSGFLSSTQLLFGMAPRLSPEGCAVAMSPSQQHIGVVLPGCGVKIFSVADRRFLSPPAEAADSTHSTEDLSRMLVDSALVGWWSDEVIAVQSTTSVNFVQIHHFSELKATLSGNFACGSVATLRGAASSPASILVMEPMMQPSETWRISNQSGRGSAGEEGR